MLLLLPLVVLLAGLFTLIFSNLRRPLRSSWLVAVGTAGVALLTLIFLRFRLPLTVSFEGWWVGEGLEFSAPVLLDPASWILAFTVTALLLSSLLNEVGQAMTATWALWARGLALTAAVLFAIFSGDLLAFVFGLTLLDLVLFVLILSEPSDWQPSRETAVRLIANLVGNMLLLGAWALPDFEGDAIAVLILIAAALRLGLFLHSQPASAKTGMTDLFRLAPFAAVLALLIRTQPMSLAALTAVQLFLLLPAAYSAWKHLSTKDDAAVYWMSGFGTIALAAAAQGSALPVLAFGTVLLFGEALLNATQSFAGKRFSLLGAVVGVGLLSGLPFTASFPASDFYAHPGSVVTYIFLPIQALLLLGWARRAGSVPNMAERPPESWMQTVQIIALVSMPIVFILFGLGAAPSFPPDDFAFAWWWGAMVLALVALFVFLAPRIRLRNAVIAVVESALSLGWLDAIGRRGFAVLTAALAFVSSILEGPAGVLWALLLIALLLSFVAQAGLGV